MPAIIKKTSKKTAAALLLIIFIPFRVCLFRTSKFTRKPGNKSDVDHQFGRIKKGGFPLQGSSPLITKAGLLKERPAPDIFLTLLVLNIDRLWFFGQNLCRC